MPFAPALPRRGGLAATLLLALGAHDTGQAAAPVADPAAPAAAASDDTSPSAGPPAAPGGPSGLLPAAASASLPPELRQALARAQLPATALSLWVQAVDAPAPKVAYGARAAVNPASLFKLATTLAALELLGPQFSWSTPVWLGGPVRQGVLDGSLHLRGSGDPRFTVERVWLLLKRVQAAGVREIRGDIVIDRSAFARSTQSPADFDGEPLKPYNVTADALMLAQRSLVYTFTPDAARGVATVAVEPALDGHQVDAELPLSTGPCDDWRAAIGATPADPARMKFSGRYPAACGERNWALAYADPASFDARLLTAMWRDMGGTLRGAVRDGAAPSAAPNFVFASPPLAEVVRDINKYSNNTMAQQLFLSLALYGNGSDAARAPATQDAARAVLRQWLARALPAAAAEALVVDNGSGLSRSARFSAEALGQLLLRGWRSPLMPELLSSLPVAGLDGTTRRSRGAVGRAHLKTGSLRDVAGVAGIVHGATGRRWVLVAVIQHPQANAARAVLDAAQNWVMQLDDRP